MRPIVLVLMPALFFATASCNPAGEGEGVARRGSRVTGSGSPGDIILSWDGGDTTTASVDIYFGKSKTGTFRKVGSIASFNRAAPEMALSRDDVGVTKGDPVCFYIVGVNAKGVSQPSEKVCGTVPST